MSALDSLQPEESLHRLLSSDLIELVLKGQGLDVQDSYPFQSLWTVLNLTPEDEEREDQDVVPRESRIHKYVQQPRKEEVQVQLMSQLPLSKFCDELLLSMHELNTKKIMIADRLKPGLLLKEVRTEIQILLRKSVKGKSKRKYRNSNKENVDCAVHVCSEAVKC